MLGKKKNKNMTSMFEDIFCGTILLLVTISSLLLCTNVHEN